MAALRTCRLLPLPRFSLSSLRKSSNVLNVYRRSINTCNFQQSIYRGTLGYQKPIKPSYFHNSLLLTQASKCTQASFSTFQKQITQSPKYKIGSFASGIRCLPTLNQIRKMKPRTKKMKPQPYVPRSEKVLLGPQRKGICIKVFIRKPKKPNSAQRKCALLKLSNGKTISAYIPRERGQLQEHGVVLFEGGRVQDCPGIKYKIVRGKLDMN